ncbi:Zn-dependent hydrolase/oxidoreductase [Pseudovirgaria hyperparasitica]|uniref:Zn-dependent hydrolase/oxidoreductase n=1 Tax=Pseudovirgaria hyperparasitica TaxID=470096 RepID=A0A6A6WH08_9PEZI|nr:Zn-dependent hydrolase/oxidoreductase [Pseudovirgaria hyperparasitica]KAF2761375.1 Zn-dependent hydrolase/oxidoreductase [Pseudovirgaria hyperparasitica]
MSSASTSNALYAAAISSSQLTKAIPEEAKELRHHQKNGKGFLNPWKSWNEQSAFKIISTVIYRRFSGKANTPDTKPPTVPVHKPTFLRSRNTQDLRATWLGHACYYVEFPGGLRVLFDPVFTHRCSPFSFLGPARYTEAPCQIEDIPTIDIVIISHSHYDHLSHPTIMKIKNCHPNAHFFVPLNNKAWFVDCGIHNVTELDWWDAKDLILSKSTEATILKAKEAGNDPETISATIGCLPCQHMSARSPFNKAHTLWASWSVESGGRKLWFGGDTGYRAVPELPDTEDDYSPELNLPHCPAFAQIGALRGPFDLGLIPIGAYSPRFIMSPMHANPYDSVNIFLDTKCRRALGMHWGTWVLTDEDVLEPPRILREALRKKGIDEVGVFDVIDIGESKEYASP